MENSNNNIEQVFQNGFKDFEHKVSEKVWQNIDAELFDNVASEQSLKGESIIKSIFISSVPFALMIGATLMLYPETPKESINTVIAINNEVEEDNKELEIVEESEVIEETENIFNNNTEEFFVIEDEVSDAVKESITESKIANESTEKEVYQPKEMPSLSDNAYIQYDYYKNKESRIYSNFSINKLKNGVLLVRLKTRQRGIDALLKMGQKKKADKLRKEVEEDNLKVMKAFSEKYNFSDVYFFYSSESENVRNKKFDGFFLNENLEVDKSIVLDPSQKFYMILDIGALKVPNVDNSTTSNVAVSRALVMKDRDFEQLYRPFPFYIGASNKKMIDLQVHKLNDSLKSYHKANQGKF